MHREYGIHENLIYFDYPPKELIPKTMFYLTTDFF
jgi:hypothetical protein